MLTSARPKILQTVDSAISMALAWKCEPFEPGMYLLNHWNFEVTHEVLDEYPDTDQYNSYGVCDSPEQWKNLFAEYAVADKHYAVAFVRIAKDEQPAIGGWRWHKWGPYIGSQNPTCEYLYDEPEIDVVYTYHVYEVAPQQ